MLRFFRFDYKPYSLDGAPPIFERMVRTSVPGLNTEFFECFSPGVVTGVGRDGKRKRLKGASPYRFQPTYAGANHPFEYWGHPSRGRGLVTALGFVTTTYRPGVGLVARVGFRDTTSWPYFVLWASQCPYRGSKFAAASNCMSWAGPTVATPGRPFSASTQASEARKRSTLSVSAMRTTLSFSWSGAANEANAA